MKKFLIILIVVTLFSYLSAFECPSDSTACCMDNNPFGCFCAPLGGTVKCNVKLTCRSPKKAFCMQGSSIMQCLCVSS